MFGSVVLSLLLSAAAPAEPRLSLSQVANSALSFIASQQATGARGIFRAGEWPSRVYSTPLPRVFGVGRLRGDFESSAFTTASVANQLALIQGKYPELSRIQSLLGPAVASFERFREGDLYNFYPAFLWKGVRVHQPAAMTLTPMWKGLTNIPQDADTTSVVYTAKAYAAKMVGQPFELPEGVLSSFQRFRDQNRRPHWYNDLHGAVDTGAFLTWQFDENDPRMPRNFYADPADGTRIPFRRNDVDCIVNLNVLRMLAVTGRSDAPGRARACRLMEDVVAREKYSSCGIYYPNTYNFAYSAALTEEAGETCLRPLGSRIVAFILDHQNDDGGWYNDGNFEFNDRVQSTAFATYALTHFGSKSDARVRSAVSRGIRFLYSRMERTPSGELYWPGETFFTATAIARSLVDWKSDAYTTAVALGALLEAQAFLKR